MKPESEMPKKHITPDVIVAKQTPQETITIAEEYNNSYMTR
jgi:hypothetical protein